MKYFIISGEASGDLHGSNLIKGLIDSDTDAVFKFMGGDLMAAECGGRGEMISHYKSTAVMGLFEILPKLAAIVDKLKLCRKTISQWRPDVVILIDFSGFNFRIAKFAKKAGFKVFYYIAPKLWARGEGRISKIRKYVDELYVIFPFEIEYFKKFGVETRYFGNPLLDSISQYHYKTIDLGRPIIALLAGSRSLELKYLMPRYVAMEKLMKSDSKWSKFQLVIAAAPSMDLETYYAYLPEDSDIKIIKGDTYSILKQSVASVICTGTASLEAALIGSPQMVCYGLNELSFFVARMSLKIKYTSLVNLIEDRAVVKEIIQHDATPSNMIKELEKIIFDEDYRSEIFSGYNQVKELLGGSGSSFRVASDMVSLLKSSFESNQ